MPRPPPNNAGDVLTRALAPFNPDLPLAVAYSGGADSTALLLACVRKWPGQVAAIHVHHGLQSAADGFALHCASTCDGLQVPLVVVRVAAHKGKGQSPEDAARKARYGALASAVGQPIGVLMCRSIALAQHADDQVETILLALSRGAGLPGLAAMRARWDHAGVGYWRPLLALSATELRNWLAQQGRAFVDDPSNVEHAFTRNRIRATVLPALEQTFGNVRDTFARSAAHAAQAQRVLDEVAQQDLLQVQSQPGDGSLPIHRLRGLSRDRQANLLRYWLRTVHRATASAAQLDELQKQLAACITRGHHIEIRVAHGVVQRQAGVLAWYNGAALPVPRS